MIDIEKLPKIIKGCHWDEGWEFDGPTVIYYPWKYRAYSDSYSNSGGIEDLVEHIIITICCNDDICFLNKHLDTDMEWRGWGRRFSRRKNATHKTYKINWFMTDKLDATWEEM